ncbi:YmfQ family protein [Pseudomonas syringae group genomosp. 3]|uniref:YmfQ family protein n=1 Tax=Pseudomonas syringae group genomosp. 3 TaxID=251701 RepID=UPI0006E5372E|nr:putative phage tail protein [Pseudomonas syringae group genomosp. 3]KPW55637.1 Tail protein [Pseudomonas syringae pv. berberidis]KPY08662.1 Tail protein [Pseudomonas syringae pv. philadelphi]RMM19327.1 Tail protein [Pseudomonas syringae pv. berberidis]RMP64945.1 Tail protein [Pseudomonas syringae pv. berberidis]RMQ27644.1 Tail protein [Pseudomonas syringae pv. berberidis]
MVVVRTAEHYAEQLQALLPPGPAWDPERVPELQQVITGLSREFARIDGRAFDLLNEMDPATVSELVPDWERVMNLPDPCLGLKPLFADRRLSVRQRLVATGGQNAGFYIDIAVSQGYPDATVTEHRAPRMGRSRFGQAYFGTWNAQFMWTLNTGGRQRLGRRFGASYWGERFGVNPGTAIECLIRRAAPAHSVEFVNFN